MYPYSYFDRKMIVRGFVNIHQNPSPNELPSLIIVMVKGAMTYIQTTFVPNTSE
jgi:hypothetical protein